jgi:hypothetical protein
MNATLSKREEMVQDILSEVERIKSMVGYTGACGDNPANIWLGASIHAIETAALYLALTEPTK